MWHVSSRSGVATLRTLVTYLLTPVQSSLSLWYPPSAADVTLPGFAAERRRNYRSIPPAAWQSAPQQTRCFCCLAHQSIASTAPTYLSADIQLVSRRTPLIFLADTRCSTHTRNTLSATEVLLSQDRACGTVHRLLQGQITGYAQFWATSENAFIHGLEIAAHCDS